jgi:hypothetical protein
MAGRRIICPHLDVIAEVDVVNSTGQRDHRFRAEQATRIEDIRRR